MLTNSPAMFQIIINDLIRDMIEVGDVVAFIDDIMVGMETEERYNKIVEEVLRRMAENHFICEAREIYVES